MPTLRNHKPACHSQAAGGGARGLHQGLPLLASLRARNPPGRFGRTDRLADATFGQQVENRGFERGILPGGRC